MTIIASALDEEHRNIRICLSFIDDLIALIHIWFLYLFRYNVCLDREAGITLAYSVQWIFSWWRRCQVEPNTSGIARLLTGNLLTAELFVKIFVCSDLRFLVKIFALCWVRNISLCWVFVITEKITSLASWRGWEWYFVLMVLFAESWEERAWHRQRVKLRSRSQRAVWEGALLGSDRAGDVDIKREITNRDSGLDRRDITENFVPFDIELCNTRSLIFLWEYFGRNLKFTIKFPWTFFPFYEVFRLGGGEVFYEVSYLKEILVGNLAVAASFDHR